MSITKTDVDHVAKLARLDLNDNEKELFTDQLNAILKYAEQLNQLNTEGVITDKPCHAVSQRHA